MILEKRLALWSITDIFIISNLKDGLCMVISVLNSLKPPLEYTVTKKFTNNFENSLMLISEFSGANRAFTGFLQFNPFNVTSLSYSLLSYQNPP